MIIGCLTELIMRYDKWFLQALLASVSVCLSLFHCLHVIFRVLLLLYTNNGISA